MLHALPDDLRTRHLPSNAFPLDRPGAPAVLTSIRGLSGGSGLHTSTGQTAEDTLARQRIRLAMHFCMLFCEYPATHIGMQGPIHILTHTSVYLHRPCFMRALVANDISMELSVQTMVEVCQHVVTLTRTVMSLDLTISRWFVSPRYPL